MAKKKRRVEPVGNAASSATRNTYIRVGIVPIPEVLPKIKLDNENDREREKAEFLGLRTNVHSMRLRTFATHGTTCAACGLEASFFALERPARSAPDFPPHLNLYGLKDGEEVLFTHDHVMARGLGGANALSNCQTMCGPCNWAKGELEGALVGIQRFAESLIPEGGCLHIWEFDDGILPEYGSFRICRYCGILEPSSPGPLELGTYR